MFSIFSMISKLLNRQSNRRSGAEQTKNHRLSKNILHNLSKREDEAEEGKLGNFGWGGVKATKLRFM